MDRPPLAVDRSCGVNLSYPRDHQRHIVMLRRTRDISVAWTARAAAPSREAVYRGPARWNEPGAQWWTRKVSRAW